MIRRQLVQYTDGGEAPDKFRDHAERNQISGLRLTQGAIDGLIGILLWLFNGARNKTNTVLRAADAILHYLLQANKCPRANKQQL